MSKKKTVIILTEDKEKNTTKNSIDEIGDKLTDSMKRMLIRKVLGEEILSKYFR